jgi:uncharacterized protein (DUF924 family)
MSVATPEDVLEFWFGPAGSAPLAGSTKWWTKDAAFDHEIKARFESTIAAAAAGELDAWKATPRGRLALVVVLDQFSRNAYRGTARSFAQDARARDLALEALDAGEDRLLEPIERSFLYMPLMHAENADLQRKCIAAFQRLCDVTTPQDLQKYTANNLDFAKKHAEIIERFGRFPHRNDILGRDSTPEEIEFLKQPGSSF